MPKPKKASNECSRCGHKPASEPHYETVGVCYYCRRDIEAIQPGGYEVRHAHDKSQYCGFKIGVD